MSEQPMDFGDVFQHRPQSGTANTCTRACADGIPPSMSRVQWRALWEGAASVFDFGLLAGREDLASHGPALEQALGRLAESSSRAVQVLERALDE